MPAWTAFQEPRYTGANKARHALRACGRRARRRHDRQGVPARKGDVEGTHSRQARSASVRNVSNPVLLTEEEMSPGVSRGSMKSLAGRVKSSTQAMTF